MRWFMRANRNAAIARRLEEIRVQNTAMSELEQKVNRLLRDSDIPINAETAIMVLASAFAAHMSECHCDGDMRLIRRDQ